MCQAYSNLKHIWTTKINQVVIPSTIAELGLGSHLNQIFPVCHTRPKIYFGYLDKWAPNHKEKEGRFSGQFNLKNDGQG